ncbi:hypothetical protein CEQ90_10665 [Lewinellaceae bacterium SD302]|nr:hypothetical protein CEQ90_10665 [Lewinellaceae bacterium SD302]
MKIITVLLVLFYSIIQGHAQGTPENTRYYLDMESCDDGIRQMLLIKDSLSSRVVDSIIIFGAQVELLDSYVSGRDSISLVYVLSNIMYIFIYHDLYVYDKVAEEYKMKRTSINSYSNFIMSRGDIMNKPGVSARGEDFIKSITLKSHSIIEVFQKENRFKNKYITRLYDLNTDAIESEIVGRRLRLYELPFE